jgi:hypothetical protein
MEGYNDQLGEVGCDYLARVRAAAQRMGTQVDAFFRVYALAKRALNRTRGKPGETRYDGIEILT